VYTLHFIGLAYMVSQCAFCHQRNAVVVLQISHEHIAHTPITHPIQSGDAMDFGRLADLGMGNTTSAGRREFEQSRLVEANTAQDIMVLASDYSCVPCHECIHRILDHTHVVCALQRLDHEQWQNIDFLGLAVDSGSFGSSAWGSCIPSS